ncbi:protein spinster-like protein 1 [Aix galericulata]|nr:protein spinster-like protein 1 [Aix galericulata]
MASPRAPQAPPVGPELRRPDDLGGEPCPTAPHGLPHSAPHSAPHGVSPARAQLTVAVLCYINLLNYMDRFTVAGVLPDVEEYFGIGDGSSGLLQTVFISSYMVLAPVFGYLGDRHDRKRLLCLGIALWSAVTLATSFVPREGDTMTPLGALVTPLGAMGCHPWVPDPRHGCCGVALGPQRCCRVPPMGALTPPRVLWGGSGTPMGAVGHHQDPRGCCRVALGHPWVALGSPWVLWGDLGPPLADAGRPHDTHGCHWVAPGPPWVTLGGPGTPRVLWGDPGSPPGCHWVTLGPPWVLWGDLGTPPG